MLTTIAVVAMLVVSKAVMTPWGGGSLPMALLITCRNNIGTCHRQQVTNTCHWVAMSHCHKKPDNGNCQCPRSCIKTADCKQDHALGAGKPMLANHAALRQLIPYLQHELGVHHTDVLLGVCLEAAKGSNVHVPRDECHTHTVVGGNALQEVIIQ